MRRAFPLRIRFLEKRVEAVGRFGGGFFRGGGIGGSVGRFFFLFRGETCADIGGFGFAVGKAAALVERVDDVMAAPAATAPAFAGMKNLDGLRFVGVGKNLGAIVGRDERRFLARRIAVAAAGADKFLAGLFETGEDRLATRQGFATAGRAANFIGWLHGAKA